MASQVYEFKTNSVTQFIATIAQNAGTALSLVLPGALAGMNGNARGILKSLSITSVENLAWELMLWQSATHGTAAAGTNAFIGRWTFVTGDAVRIGGTGEYFYYIDGLNVPVVDLDNTGKLHMTLINRSAAGKSADAAGAVQVRGSIELTY